MRTLTVALAAALAVSGCKRESRDGAADAREPLTVAAAADLSDAFKDIGDAFEKKTGRKVTITFGATGNLEKQIAEGARYDVFAAANKGFVDDAVTAGACDGATKALYAIGHLVIWTKDDTKAPAKIDDLADPRFVKIAIANPEHAPYGKAAKEALQSAGIWDKVKDRIVNGENVRQALQFAESGNADAAIVGLSLSLSAKGGHGLPVDPSLHTPLEQTMVVCKRGGAGVAAAKQFEDYVVKDPGARVIMKKYGFLLPDES